MALYLWHFTFRATNRVRDEPAFSAVIVTLFVFAGIHTLFGYLLPLSVSYTGQGVDEFLFKRLQGLNLLCFARSRVTL